MIKLVGRQHTSYIMDEIPSWDEHVKHVLSKLVLGLFFIQRRILYLWDSEILKIIIFLNILPIAMSIYAGASKFNLDQPLKVQMSPIRVILHSVNYNYSSMTHCKVRVC